AGAIPIGRTNMPDMGLRLHTDSALYGLTRNPWNLGRTVGGSSGGEAAVLATGMSPIGLGKPIGGGAPDPPAPVVAAAPAAAPRCVLLRHRVAQAVVRTQPARIESRARERRAGFANDGGAGPHGAYGCGPSHRPGGARRSASARSDVVSGAARLARTANACA